MAVAHSQQPPLWDPQTLFKIVNPNHSNSITCVGCAITKDRRCKRCIGKDRRNAAEYLMNRLAFIEPRQIIEQEMARLEEIAYYSLCSTHLEGPHGQWDSMVLKWVTALEEEQTRLESRQARRETERSERDGSASARVSRSGSSTSVVSSRSTSQDRIERRERSTSPTNSLMTPQSTAPPPVATPNRFSSPSSVSTSVVTRPALVTAQPSRDELSAESGGDINTDTRVEDMYRDMQRQFENMQTELEDTRRTVDGLVRYISMRSTELQRPPEADAVVPLPVTLNQEQEPHASVTLTPEPNLSLDFGSTAPPSIDQQCLLHHASRRSIDEDCPICTMPMVNCMLPELVWCKQQCGRSVHKDCFEQMLQLASNNMRCVYWSVSTRNPCLSSC